MITVDIKGKKVEMWDSIDELPIRRFHKFNKYMLVDSGIGSDLNDIDTHIYKVMKFIEMDDKDNARLQLENMRQSLYMISQENNIRHLSFITLIKSLDGVDVTDLSDENIKRLSEIFNKKSVTFVDRIINSFKKKVDEELALYFPGYFDDTTAKEYCDKIRERALLQIDAILKEVDNNELINKVEEFLVNLAKPKVFSGAKSVEIAYDKQFEEMCLYLKKETGVDAESMNVLQFYNAFEYIKKLNKPNKK